MGVEDTIGQVSSSVSFARSGWQSGLCRQRERGRNERMVVSAKRDRRRLGPPMNNNHRRACGGLSERMSGENRPHGQAWSTESSVIAIQRDEVTGNEGGDEQ